MKIIPNDAAKIFVEQNYELINKFIIEHLDGPDKKQLFEILNIRIEQFDGDQEHPPGKMEIREDYWNPLITLYECPMMIELADSFWDTWTFDQFRLEILFHELSHLVIMLSDIEKNKHLFKDDQEHSLYDSEEETLCNVMSERFLRSNSLLDDVRNIFYAPESLQIMVFRNHYKF